MNEILLILFSLIIMLAFLLGFIQLSKSSGSILERYLKKNTIKLIRRFFSFLLLFLVFNNLNFGTSIFIIILLTFNKRFLCSEGKEEASEEDEEDLSK